MELDCDLRVGSETEIVVHDVEGEVVGRVHARVFARARRCVAVARHQQAPA